MPECRICGNTEGNTAYHVREMMLGTRQVFDYFQCAHCGCLQIASPPENLADFYPTQYFSFRDYRKLSGKAWRAWIDRQRVEQALSSQDHLLGTLFNRFAKPLDYVDWLKRAGQSVDSRILDVGCGSGRLLLRMRLGGLRHCMGIDPFLAQDIRYQNGLTISKKDLGECHGQFDLIMFHHSFEHMANPSEVLAEADRLLAPGGTILIRVPLADSVAWERYREHWWNLDAPRHLFLFTQKSMHLLAEQAGLEIYDSFRDATTYQFLNSELYSRDIPLSAGVDPQKLLGRTQLLEFRRLTKQLNLDGRGDMGGFCLRRKTKEPT